MSNTPAEYKNKTFFLLGLGSSGLAAFEFLNKAGATMLGWDEDPAMLEKAPDKIKPQNPTGFDWQGVDYLLISPAISTADPVVQAALDAGVTLKSDVDMLQEAAPAATYIGVTGTSGKSTAVALIAHILRHAGKEVTVGGHMGRPPLAMPLLDEGSFYVLEIAAQQLETMETFHPHVAVLLNISPEHLDRFGTMEAYQAMKQKIFNNQQPTDLRVLSVDNYELEQMGMALGLNVPLRRISVTGVGADISVNADGHLLDYDTTPPRFIINLNSLEQLEGLHNWQNITCAWAATKSYVTKEQFVDALNNFEGVRHRYQKFLVEGNIAFINDSKATTGRAAVRGLANTPNPYWIVGGREKEEGIEKCLEVIDVARGVYLIGEAADNFASVLKEAKVKCPVHKCGTLEAATRKAYADACAFQKKHPRTKTAVLLSPACDSFDQFYSFEDRGQQFMDMAFSLTGQTPPASRGD